MNKPNIHVCKIFGSDWHAVLFFANNIQEEAFYKFYCNTYGQFVIWLIVMILWRDCINLNAWKKYEPKGEDWTGFMIMGESMLLVTYNWPFLPLWDHFRVHLSLTTFFSLTYIYGHYAPYIRRFFFNVSPTGYSAGYVWLQLKKIIH